jgi:hypothetical protein
LLRKIDAALLTLAYLPRRDILVADEASLVLCQLWAERRRRWLVVCPASIRTQWSLDVEEQFKLTLGGSSGNEK